MTLYELIELWESNSLREDLGDEWVYDDFGEGFNIQYKDWLGGLQIVVVPDSWGDSFRDRVKVNKILNNKTKEIYNKEKNRENDIELELLHFGVNQRLKYILGY